ncbi:serine hydrolase domain-containing protein [Catenuloplanes atrovinosus]|uniref:D-alanyl-D-alanine carboxypeptidase n=1 Tax=Catenuloplanes atrovinosus TaxID=137266 RepID=A0AAE3YR36_9ACTN|nr:serine hydrolase domain-containing protein [Catenuloplanes atrovinosus]MDR7278438.1 D-alanyl-D-alanine carboxypeptidase [Catenuloplanes atrovinosus]
MSKPWRNRGLWNRAGAAVAAIVLAGTAALTHTGVAFAAPGNALKGEIQPLLDAITASGVPGSYAQVRRDGKTFTGASGVAFVESGAPARADSRHRIGSVTKTFVATTVLQLVGERRLSLDTSVDQLLPRFGLDPAITVRMLLNHTSGIGNYTLGLDSLEAVEEWQTRTFAPDELVRLGLTFPETGAPGELLSYSNTNYILAGLIIEKVTGNEVEKEVNRRIIKPLGLRTTYFPGADPRIRGPHAGAYVPWPDAETGEVTLRDFSVYNMTWAWTAGEMISTMPDLNTFYRALITGKLLKPAQQAAMLETVPWYPEMPEALRYGLGIYALQLPCGTFWGHDGGVIGQITQVLTSTDGRTQLAWGGNYGINFASTPEMITALNNLIVGSLCGPEAVAGADQRRAAGATNVPLLPSAVRVGD